MARRQVSHPVFARMYPRVAHSLDRGGFADYRRRLLADLHGMVVEVGAGHGGNLPYYPAAVTRVVAIEPEPRLRITALAAAERSDRPVDVVAGLADRLPIADSAVDAVVFSLVLCSVADPAAAMAEARRVLRPGGEVRLLEHVRAATPRMRVVQRVLDATLWPVFAGGCHTGRDTAALLEPAGLEVDRIDWFHFPQGPNPAGNHILAVARKPAGPPTASTPDEADEASGPT